MQFISFVYNVYLLVLINCSIKVQKYKKILNTIKSLDHMTILLMGFQQTKQKSKTQKEKFLQLCFSIC